jgi:hypothetical protein
MIAAGAAALILAGGSSAEAGGRGHGQLFHAQAGGGNSAHTSQRGNRNSSAIRQSGSGNVARTIQRGDDNQAGIFQTGDNNRGRIVQIGDGLSATHHQQGGERSNIIQVNRGNASVDIVTGPGHRGNSGNARRY